MRVDYLRLIDIFEDYHKSLVSVCLIKKLQHKGMIVTKRFTLQEIANGEHQILGHKFLYFKKLKQPFMNSGVTIGLDGMAIAHRIPVPYKKTRKHDPNYIVRCYYEKQNAPNRPEYQSTSRQDRLNFIKSLFPEPSYGRAYKMRDYDFSKNQSL